MILEFFNNWSAAITAAFTVVLGVFAIAAWRTSSAALKQSKVDSTQSEVRSAEALDAQRNATDLQRQAIEIKALSSYVSALSALGRLQHKSPPAYMTPGTGSIQVDWSTDRGYSSYVNDMCHAVEVTGMMWRIHHAELEPLLSEFFRAEQVLLEAQEWRRDTRYSPDDREEQFVLNAKFVDDIAYAARRWQVHPSRRESTIALIESALSKFIGDSPCRPLQSVSPNRSDIHAASFAAASVVTRTQS